LDGLKFRRIFACGEAGSKGFVDHFQDIEVGERKVLKLILRLHMEHVTYPHVAQTIALLDQYFTPVDISVDCAC